MQVGYDELGLAYVAKSLHVPPFATSMPARRTLATLVLPQDPAGNSEPNFRGRFGSIYAIHVNEHYSSLTRLSTLLTLSSAH